MIKMVEGIVTTPYYQINFKKIQPHLVILDEQD